jgi:hypothetical protein
MKLIGTLRTSAATIAVISLSACSPTPPSKINHPAHGIGVALGYVAASPLLILVGLVEGIAAAPYFIEGDIQKMNDAMVSSGSNVNLDRTYRSAYGKSLKDVPQDGNTGRVFRHMGEATAHFQRVLSGYGVENAKQYVLTAVRTADRDGFTLYAVVYRPSERIKVKTSTGTKTLTSRDPEYYQPHAKDATGRPLDVVIDWAGVPRTSIRTQKGQAILMTLAANSVLINRRSDEYWNAERLWKGGGFHRIVSDRKSVLDRRMA